ncbi:aldo/keto reductase [Streptomyces sp. LHD-70]|uniref:aldo/keto reductase n=1 Tax=Streptomyces sp. LHD-70 TaxID=3072140 RepID=UPI00280F8C42|nr:aldo/keto reductase [Streptomyces sp. LHD-70]MDQ8701136.1 aldo/keto reductase [Streptomyces sp. LHD-70]
MHTRRLGTHGPLVSELGLGCMGMSAFYGPRNDDDARNTLLTALDLGITLFDTADAYGNGHNEQLLGRVLGPHRDRVTLATKCGIRSVSSQGTSGGAVIDSSPAYIRQACEASLTRLGTDHIDVYYLHRRDPGIPIEESVGAMAELVHEGKVRHLGLSEVSATTLQGAHATHPIAALQTEYSLWERSLEDDIIPTARRLGAAIVPYSPLGRGFLTGAVTSLHHLTADDYRHHDPRFQGGNLTHNLALIDRVRDIADRHEATPGQIALAWLLAQGDDIVPIPGTKRRTYLRENSEATALRLTGDDLDTLTRSVPRDAVHGPRYGDKALQLLNT